MRRFKFAFQLAVFILSVFLVSGELRARTILSDGPFPWGTEASFDWSRLHGTWRTQGYQRGGSTPFLLKFHVSKRGGGVFLVTSQVVLEGRPMAQGYAFVVSDQRSLNVPYFGDGLVPLAVIRDYVEPTLRPFWNQDHVVLTWVWDANNPNFVYQHMQLEKISNDPEL